MEAVVAVVLAVLSIGLLWYAWREISAVPEETERSSGLQDRMRPPEEGPREPLEEELAEGTAPGLGREGPGPTDRRGAGSDVEPGAAGVAPEELAAGLFRDEPAEDVEVPEGPPEPQPSEPQPPESGAPGPDVGPLGSEGAEPPEERDAAMGLPEYVPPEQREEAAEEPTAAGAGPAVDEPAEAEEPAVEGAAEVPAEEPVEETEAPVEEAVEPGEAEAPAPEKDLEPPTAAAAGAAAAAAGAEQPGPPDADYELYAAESDAGRGFRIRRAPGGDPIPWRSLPLEEGLLAFEAAGVRDHLDVAQLAEFAPGEPIRLVPEDGAGEDAAADGSLRVAVYDAGREYRVGYVPADQSELVAELMRADPDYRGLALWETTEEGQVIGLRVLITASDASVRLPGSPVE